MEIKFHLPGLRRNYPKRKLASSTCKQLRGVVTVNADRFCQSDGKSEFW